MTSLIESQRRRLLRHGFIFLFVGLWLGIATATLPHPRAWLAAHLTAFFTCLVLVAIGLVWREAASHRTPAIDCPDRRPHSPPTRAWRGTSSARLWTCRARRRSQASRHLCLRPRFNSR